MAPRGTPVSESSETKECRNSRGSVGRIEPGHQGQGAAKVTADVGGVHASAEPGGEHEHGLGPPLPAANRSFACTRWTRSASHRDWLRPACGATFGF
jgi:hypothetical protein